jgi:hypothetical protein
MPSLRKQLWTKRFFFLSRNIAKTLHTHSNPSHSAYRTANFSLCAQPSMTSWSVGPTRSNPTSTTIAPMLYTKYRQVRWSPYMIVSKYKTAYARQRNCIVLYNSLFCDRFFFHTNCICDTRVLLRGSECNFLSLQQLSRMNGIVLFHTVCVHNE